ncbi:MAG: T9SS type A sorting domain-containing protein [Chitinophagaceae bacterium]|nr:T9SS type A sorting domain-containing protein [Chitinophagaceae bacterium]
MKRKITFMMAMLIGLGVQAQNWVNDSISMGVGSVNDVFYNMENGTVRTENNKNWHLAFSLSIADSAAIWANHNAGTSFVKVYNIHKDSSQWGSVTLADTAAASLCFNNDQGWYQGALNAIPSSDIFNYGWGTYDQTTHKIKGDSIFIVKANNVFYKVFINELDAAPMNWRISVGDIVNNTSVTDTISKQPGFASRLFAYYDLATLSDTNREPDIASWDLLFTRYTTNNPTSGQNPFNNVLGVLANTNGSAGVRIAQASVVDVDTAFANQSTYLPMMNSNISTIGFNWKTFDLATFTYFVEDSNSYFIKGKSGTIYQLMFTGFSGINGPGSGMTYFSKRTLAPTIVSDPNALVNQYSIFPVPASDKINMVLDAKQEADAMMTVTDIQGKVLLRAKLAVHQGLNAFVVPSASFPSGNYLLSVTGKNIQIKSKISINK